MSATPPHSGEPPPPADTGVLVFRTGSHTNRELNLLLDRVNAARRGDRRYTLNSVLNAAAAVAAERPAQMTVAIATARGRARPEQSRKTFRTRPATTAAIRELRAVHSRPAGKPHSFDVIISAVVGVGAARFTELMKKIEQLP